VSGITQRRNPLRLIVNKETQLRILWLVGGGTFVTVAGVLLIANWLHDWVWIIALALVIGSFVSLWVSRRIAGPFYRIEKDLEAILSGAASGSSIRLRDGDPLGHLAELVNQLAARDKTARLP
jgi:hypothetical protein